jgi:hypothetical protein
VTVGVEAAHESKRAISPSSRAASQNWLAARSPKHGGVGGDRAAFYYDAVGKEVHPLRSCVVLSAICPFGYAEVLLCLTRTEITVNRC